MTEVLIVDGARTPFGSFGGALRDVSAEELGLVAAKEAIRRAGFAASQVDNVVLGNVIQSHKGLLTWPGMWLSGRGSPLRPRRWWSTVSAARDCRR